MLAVQALELQMEKKKINAKKLILRKCLVNSSPVLDILEIVYA